MAVYFSGTQTIFLLDTQTMNKSATHIRDHHVKIVEDNKEALYFYFRGNVKKRGYRKRMNGIWTGFARFMTTNQRLADQNGWFSVLEIQKIHLQIYQQTYQQTPYKLTYTLNTGKSETPKS